MQDAKAVRIEAITALNMNAAQREAAAELERGPRGGVRGPFAVMLHSPGAFVAAQRLGEYLRFESEMPAVLRELAVLVAARKWRQGYEWRAHAPLAEKAGLASGAIAAIANGERPELTPEQDVIFSFCDQLHDKRCVDDATFAAAQDLVGTKGVIDLCAISGYYAMLAMVMNVARNPPTAPPLLPFE